LLWEVGRDKGLPPLVFPGMATGRVVGLCT
jgi:hypothetical protein